LPVLALEAVAGYGGASGASVLNVLVASAMVVALVLLLLRRVRRWTNPVLWLVIVVLLGGTAHFARSPLAAIANARFFAADPGYAAAASPFDGRSLYIPDPCWLARGALGAMDWTSDGQCGLPVAERLRSGDLDFIETGTDPILRFDLRIGDPACHAGADQRPPSLTTMISAPFAVCVIGRPVPASTADHRIDQTPGTVPAPGDASYTAVTLRRVASDTLIDRFDSWPGATPYGGDTPPPEARRPSGPLAAFLAPPPPRPDDFQRIVSDRLFAAWGVDEQSLRAGARNPLQSQRAETIWFACRDDVLPMLTPETVAALRDGAANLFPDQPNWRYPDDCPAFSRRGVDAAAAVADIALPDPVLRP
jgi:hypothetical protein